MRSHCTPIRMAELKNTDNSKCCEGGELQSSLPQAGCRAVHSPLEDSSAVSYKSKTPLPSDAAVTLLGIHPTNWKLVSTQRPHWNVHSRFLHICQNLEATKIALNRWWINKLWYVHTRQYYSATKESAIERHRGLKCILVSKRSQSEKLHSVRL